MLRIIRSILLKIVDDIDAGNSNITEDEATKLIDTLRVRLHLTLSFYLYCNYFTYMNKVIYLSCCRHTKLYLPLCCLKNKKVEEYGRRTKFR